MTTLCRSLFLPSLLLAGVLSSRAGEVVINEIMYHPYHAAEAREPVEEEYIELFNRGTNAVNLAGWRFTKGVSFDFTNGPIILAPGGYLVVAANLEVFQTKYPGVLDVVGNWTGALRDRGETLELEDAAGQVQDSVPYSNEGDWGIRQRGPLLSGTRGWVWYADHDGYGKSLERLNPHRPGRYGANWEASIAFNGTPGVANSTNAPDLAPIIADVEHAPAVPRSADPVTIIARILDEQTAGLTVALRYRNASTNWASLGAMTNWPAFQTTNMFDDATHGDALAGDGIYAAVLPPLPARTVIEFYVQATDALGQTRTWPAPTIESNGVAGQFANALYQVDDEVYTGTQPVYRLVNTESERVVFVNINRNSDAQMNTTFVSVDGTSTKIRHLCGLRIRGAGTRSRTPPNVRVNIPNDRLWNGVDSINLNAAFTHVQVLGSQLSLKSGMVAANARAVQVRINGVNQAYASPIVGNANTWQFGSYAHMEVLDGDWAANHFPQDSDGNMYRASTGNHNADLSYGTEAAYFLARGYTKTANTGENDWSDLVHLTDVLNNTPQADWVAAVSQVANVELWMRYFAFMTMIASMETSIANGRGDDYSMVRGELDPRFLLLPHDLDTICGEGDWANATAAATSSIFRMVPAAGAQVPGFQTPNVPILNRLFTNQTFVAYYYRELQRMLDTVFVPENFALQVDQALGSWVPPTDRDRIKAWQTQRNASVRSQISLRLAVTNLPAVVNGYPRTTSPTVTVGGQANVLDTEQVLVNGQPALWLRWRGTWSAPGLTLTPGINRIVVQALDANGVEFERAFADVWYDRGATTPVSGQIDTDTTWTAENGPYVVSGSLAVYATLTIQPGTTVYFAPGADLFVGGILDAAGTDAQRIRFTRAPGTTGTWAGVVLEDTQMDNRLAFVDFDYAEGGAQNILVANSVLYVENCTWSNTTKTIITLNRSSLDVRDSVFPTLANAAHIRGGPMPGGGFVVIEGNTFGGTSGAFDIIRFNGAARPGPVLQVLNNLFTGASDDVLDLDGTDAHVEGNVFLNVRKNNTVDEETSSALSIGRAVYGGTNYAPHVVAVRNLFYNVDHVALVKDRASLTLINNTAVGLVIAGVNFSEPERGTLPGAGALLDGNIFFNPPGFAGTNFQNYPPTNGPATLTLARNIFASSDHASAGTNDNLVTDPRLENPTPTNITWTSLWRDFSLRAGSPGLGSGPNGLDRGGVVPAGASISGEPTSPTSLSSATLAVGGPGIVSYIYRVNGGSYSTERPVATPITLSGLANGTYTVEVLGRNSAGVWQDLTRPTVSRAWEVNTSLTLLVINEVLARNSTTLVVNGETPDLVELRNAGATVLNLGGMGLTDDPTQPYKFTFPANLALEPGDYLVLYADNGPDPGRYLGFALSQDGDGLYLFDKPAAGGALRDSVEFGAQLADLSIGRLPAGGWGLTQPTFPGPNAPLPVGDYRGLKLNEWLAKAVFAYAADFVELYNPDTLPVNLGGFYLTDEPAGYPTRYQLAPLSFIGANGHLVFLADGNPEDGRNHLSFRLSPEQGYLGLFTPEVCLVDCIFYGPQFTDVSEGRRPSGGATITLLPTPTPGAANPGLSGYTTISNVVVSIPLLPMATTWRFDQRGVDLGTAWRDPFFDDSGWSSGQALLAYETPGVYSEPIRTTLNLTNAAGTAQVITYYFRTTLVVNTNLEGYTLLASAYVDDGAAFYVNGVDTARLRLTNATVLYTTLAQNQGAEGSLENFVLPAGSLVPGANALAVEVHQSSTTSSDVAFGLALAAVRTNWFTNVIGVSVVLNEVLASNGSFTNADGTLTDLVELYNPSTNVVDLANMSLTDTVNAPRRWVFPAGAQLAAGDRLVVRFDPNSPPTVVNGPVLNTGFGLDAGADAVYLYDTPARQGALLDSVVFGLQAVDFSIGRVPDGIGSWRLTLPTFGAANLPATLGPVTALRINEWMADPRSGADWFELYNPSPQPVALAGLFFTDDLGRPERSPIPPLSFLGTATNGFAKFIADSTPAQGADHVNFRLDKDGDLIALLQKAPLPPIDIVQFGLQEQGVSEGRFPDGSTNIARFPDTESPGDSNYLPLRHVVISEVLSRSDAPLEDAVELQNLSSDYVDVSGWWLSDSRNDLRKFRLPAGAVLEPGGFAVFYEYQFNVEPGRAPNFAFSSTKGDQAWLSAADPAGNLLGYRAQVKFGALDQSLSFGRHETSTGPDFTALSNRTFGVDQPTNLVHFRSGTGLTNGGPRVGPVVISEIMYHPPNIGTNDNVGDEFIELKNLTGSPVPLFDPAYPTNTWRLRDAVDFEFPSGTNLAAGGYVLVVSFNPTNTAQLDAFRARYGVAAAVPVFGPYRGKLANDFNNIELYKPDIPVAPPSPDAGLVPYVQVDKVKYYDSTPWPSLADGNTNGVGYSLQRRVEGDYGNDPVNWLAGAPTPGAAAGPAAATLPSIIAPPQNQVTSDGGSATFTVSAFGAAPLKFQWRFNGWPLAGATNSVLTLTNVHSTNEGRYAVLVSNPAGAVSSGQVFLALQSPPVILAQPQSQVVITGAVAGFSVTAEGSKPLRYQWRKEDAALPNRTNATLTLTNAQPADQGGYTVVVTNRFGALTSAVAQLAVHLPPHITLPPTNLTLLAGDTAVFMVGAEGSPPLGYQWRFNGAPITGQTNAALTLNNVQGGSAGDYTCVVTNLVGAVTSTVARLTVILPPVVTVVATDPDAGETGLNPGAFTFTRSYATNTALAVNFTVAGTATPGADYAALTSPAVIPANQTSVTLTVTPVNDSEPERPETVIVSLASGPGYTLGTPGVATVTIADDDNVLPSVTLTAPTNGTLFPITPTNVLVTASASDLDGTIARVEFYWQGTNRIGVASNAPFTIAWASATAGSNALTALAVDNLDGTSTSAPVVIILNALPTVAITSPTSGSRFTAPADIPLVASASDADGTVTRVEFLEGTNLLGTLTASPYTLTWSNVDVGTYSLTARATDDRGATRTSQAVTVQVTLAGGLWFTNNFANRNIISGAPLSIPGSTSGATTEGGEPTQSGTIRRTVWIGWTAFQSGPVTMSTLGSAINTTLGVFTGTAVNALTQVAYNNDYGGTLQSLVTFEAVAGTTYNVQVGRPFGYSDGAFTLQITLPTAPPEITAQPASQTVPRGSTATFSVTASGTAPLSYQWRFNAVNLPGATGAVYTVTNAQLAHEGLYSVVVTNAYGSALSSSATLRVDDGLVVSQRPLLVPLRTGWRYNESTVDLGTAWRLPDFNDGAWPSGPALLGYEDSVPYPYFEPISTPLGSPAVNGALTVYFRTRFQFTNTGGANALVSSNWVDDGAVYYLNGVELGRLRMASGPVAYTNLATLANPEGQTNVLTFAADALLPGENLLAVEVHQNAATSSDVVFGMTLEAIINYTNQPVFTAAQRLANGSFQMTLSGVAGRPYAIDASTNLLNWAMLTTFTNLTGQYQYTDTTAASRPARFYRARLAQ